MKIPIHETFHSWQGEGNHMGRSAYFIRTFGCPVHCPWCDSAGTWHPKHIPERIARVEAYELARNAKESGAEITIITGGEPAIHDLTNLTLALREAGQPVHLETSGAFLIRGEFDWVTLSPKRWKAPIPEAIDQADEFKVVVDTPEAIKQSLALLHPQRKSGTPVWLHPEWSRRTDNNITDAIDRWVREHGAPFRAGHQLHKFYGVR